MEQDAVIPVVVSPSIDEQVVESLSKQLALENIEEYMDAITQLKKHIISLVQNQYMSEAVATRLIGESEYGFFQQLVKISYQ
jgi:hypothetical protein